MGELEFLMLERMPFAVALKTAREMARMSQQKLADELGLPVSMIYRWESGKDDHFPSANTLPRLKAALGRAGTYLAKWDHAQTMSFQKFLAPKKPMSAHEMSVAVLRLAKEVGDVADVARKKLADEECSDDDARNMAKELRDVLGSAHELYILLPMFCKDKIVE